MSFAYEVDRSQLTPEQAEQLSESAGRRARDGSQYQAWRHETFDPSGWTGVTLTEIATEEAYGLLVNTEGGRYTPAKTAEDIERDRLAMIESKFNQIHKAVNAKRKEIGVDLLFQTRAYDIKAERASSWDGTGEPPRGITAAAGKLGKTDQEAKTAIEGMAIAFPDWLEETEWLREEAEAIAISGGDVSGKIDEINAVGT